AGSRPARCWRPVPCSHRESISRKGSSGPAAPPPFAVISRTGSARSWRNRRNITSITHAVTGKRWTPRHRVHSRSCPAGTGGVQAPAPAVRSKPLFELQVPLPGRARLALDVRLPKVLQNEEVVVVQLVEQVGDAERGGKAEVGQVVSQP